MSEPLELFHAIGDPASAAARRRVTELGLLKRLKLRNIVYPEVKKDFDARGGTQLPALWDGATLVQGGSAVKAALDALASGSAP